MYNSDKIKAAYMEYFDIVDENGKPLDIKKSRAETHKVKRKNILNNGAISA